MGGRISARLGCLPLFVVGRSELPARCASKTLVCCCCRDRLVELRRAILEEQEKVLQPDHVFPSAFVSFRNRTSQVHAWAAVIAPAGCCDGVPHLGSGC